MSNFVREEIVSGLGGVISQRDISMADFYIIVGDVRYEGFGHAKRNGSDKPLYEVGQKLALARALKSIVNQLEKQANGLVTNQENEKKRRKDLMKQKASKVVAKTTVKKKATKKTGKSTKTKASK